MVLILADSKLVTIPLRSARKDSSSGSCDENSFIFRKKGALAGIHVVLGIYGEKYCVTVQYLPTASVIP
jgi:hypothetical protein